MILNNIRLQLSCLYCTHAFATYLVGQSRVVGGATGNHQHLPATQDLVKVGSHSPKHDLKIETSSDYFLLSWGYCTDRVVHLLR